MQEPTFAEWYRNAYPGLLESVLRAVRRRTLAEDAVDEAFEKAFSRWERVQAMRSPQGWVYRVAVNAARRQVSRGNRAEERAAFAAGLGGIEAPPGGETWLVVADLPIRQRTAVTLRHVAGMTEVEVAAAMGVTRSTVSSTLTAAYKSLAQALAEPTPKEEERAMEMDLAVAKACDAAGCELDYLAGGAGRAVWSDAVRNAIKVRPGDLVAVAGGEVVWRWWGGIVVELAAGVAIVERRVTQADATGARTATMEVDADDDLDLAVGDRVWFGPDGDRKAVVASGAPEAVVKRVAPRLPAVARALGG